MLKEKEELFNNNISEIADVNRMVFVCYFICVTVLSIGDIPMYWYGDTTWHIADPLFSYLSMWLPLLTAYYAFLRRKDTMFMREIVYGSILVFYTFVLFTNKGVLF